MFTGQKIEDVNAYSNLSAPLSKINVHVRGGQILPLQAPEVTTAQRFEKIWLLPQYSTYYASFGIVLILSRKNPFSILVALNSDASLQSYGSLFWDDGETPSTCVNLKTF